MKKLLYTGIFIGSLIIFASNEIVFAQDKVDSYDSKALIENGLRLYEQKDYNKAIDNFQQAYILDSNNPILLYYIAKSYDKNNNNLNATCYYKKTVDLDNDMAPAMYNLALIYAKEKRYDEAINYFKRAIKSDKKLSYAYYNMGNIFYEQNKYQAAIDNYLKTISLNAEYPDSYYNLAKIYEMTDRKNLALKYYEKYNNLQPGNSKVEGKIESLKNQSEG